MTFSDPAVNRSHLLGTSSFNFWNFLPWSFSTSLCCFLFVLSRFDNTRGKKTSWKWIQRENEIRVGNRSARSPSRARGWLALPLGRTQWRELAEQLQDLQGGPALTWPVCWALWSSLISPACGALHSLWIEREDVRLGFPICYRLWWYTCICSALLI